MKNNIKNGNLYRMKSPVKKQDIIVEIISVGNSYMLIDIFIKGNKNKKRRHIDIKNNGFEIDDKNLILNFDDFKNIAVYNKLRNKIINEWKNGQEVDLYVEYEI